MTVPLTYLEFHALFVVPPIACLGYLAYSRDRALWGVEPLSGLAILIVLAVSYTTPWDNLLIAAGVWWYGEGAVLARLWYAPIEEYLFFVLQPILTAFWLFQLPQPDVDRSLAIPQAHRLAGILTGLGIAVVGLVMLAVPSTFYLGAISLWAGPILAIQWGFGSTYCWHARRTLAIGVLVPTVYLWIVDRIAIGLEIWTISTTYTTGYTLVGLPIEEAVFFLVTNVFVVQTILLYLWLLERRHELTTTRPLGVFPPVPTLEGATTRREPTGQRGDDHESQGDER